MALKAAFDALYKIPPHGVIDGFLGEALAGDLLEYAIAHEADFAVSEVDDGQEVKVDAESRISRVLRDLGPFGPLLEEHFSRALQSAAAVLGEPPFVPGKVELELVAHDDGACFKPHNDMFNSPDIVQNDRVITFTYNVHRTPRAFTGGELRLYPLLVEADQERHADIDPRHDRLAYFQSWFTHEVLPVRCPSRLFADSRFTVNCWFHRSAEDMHDPG